MYIQINWDSSVTSAPLSIQTEFMTDVSQVASFFDSEIKNPITITIGGKTVEVCCDECAQRLKEADASTTARRKR